MIATSRPATGPPATGPVWADRRVAFALGVFAVLVVATAALVLYVRGGGPLPAWAAGLGDDTPHPPAASTAEEATLRSLRLAGIDLAAVGEDRGTAIVRLRMPETPTPGHVVTAWRIAFATLAEAFPDADGYVVQLYGVHGPLLSVSADGDEVRSAVDDDAAGRLERAATFELVAEDDPGTEILERPDALPADGFFAHVAAGLSDRTPRAPSSSEVWSAEARQFAAAVPRGGESLPEDAVRMYADLGGRYLDAKNEAAFAGEAGSAVAEKAEAAAEALEGVAAATARPVAPADVSRVRFYGARLADSLVALDEAGASDGASAGASDGVASVRDSLDRLAASASDPAPRLKELSEAARAVELAVGAADAPALPGAGLSAAAGLAREVLDAPVPMEGSVAEAVLAEARHPSAPEEAYDLERFERVEDEDVAASASGGVVARVLERAGGRTAEGRRTVSWSTEAGRTEVAFDTLRAYRSPAGALYWRPGEDADVAVTDTTLRGWAFTVPSGALVDVGHVGRIVEVYDLG